MTEARERLGLTEAEIAARLGVSDSEYQDIEFHRDEAFVVCSVKQLARLAAVLEMSIDGLLFGPGAAVSSTSVDVAEIAQRIQDCVAAEGKNLEAFEDRVGWELAGILARPESIHDLPVMGLYAICSAVGVDWASALPRTVPG